MRICPNCGNRSNMIGWEGWVVKARAVAILDKETSKIIINPGAAKVLSAVKQGREIDNAEHLLWYCTECGHKSSDINDFAIVEESYICALSGKPTTVVLELDGIRIPVHPDYEDAAQEIFTTEFLGIETEGYDF